MDHGKETWATHSFGEYCAISLSRHKKVILDFLRQNKNVRVLDIGCGEGTALQELGRFCQHEKLKNVMLFGLDKQEPKSKAEGYKFIRGDIATLNPNEFEKFDLIISVNVLHYVTDKKHALENMSRLLTQRGKAFISIEPFYFGPHGVKLFSYGDCCQWDEDFCNILVSPSNEPNLMQTMTAYSLPKELKSHLWRAKSGLNLRVPGFYSKQTIRSIKQREQLVKKLGTAVFWDSIEFLEVRTPNENGPMNVGKHPCHPFSFGIMSPYLYQSNLSNSELVRLLIDKSVYDEQSVNPDWKPSEDYGKLCGQLYEFTQVDFNSDELKACSLRERLLSKYKSNDPHQALRRASHQGDVRDVMQTLTSFPKTDLNKPDDNPNKGYTALDIALMRNKLDVAAFLVLKGANLDIALLKKIIKQPNASTGYQQLRKVLLNRNDVKEMPAFYRTLLAAKPTPTQQLKAMITPSNGIKLALCIIFLAILIKAMQAATTQAPSFNRN